MEALLIMAVSFVGYIVMYWVYGQFIAKKIFAVSDTAPVPAVTHKDGVDYVPTKKEVIFGHHFASIAGTGPIVGPAIAIIWGWVPALLWVFLGSIFMGAVHDFGSLIISMRNEGKSISDYTAKYVNKRTRFLFFVIVFLELWIVIAVFGLVIASIFKMYPMSVVAVWMEVPIAVGLGYFAYKKGKGILGLSIWALILMYVFVFLGPYMPVSMPDFDWMPATGMWTIILLIYAFIASVLPVTTLLQPRDFINSHELVVAMILLVLGVFASAFSGQLEVVAPQVNTTPEAAPAMWPFLFITIACGAISGFHCLVSSGTSSKQVKSESDSVFVGYGSMLMEGALAILVIIAVSAGIGMAYVVTDGDTQTTLTGVEAWSHHYASWTAASGLGSKVAAFVDGSANMIGALGVPRACALAVMAVFVASFAGTTLDTATRIQRYVLSELFCSVKCNWLSGKYITTALAVGTAAALAFATGASGKGALKLWPLFGAVNQTLAALALIIISIYLKQKGGLKWLVSGIPALLMVVMVLWAIVMNQTTFKTGENLLLQIINVVTLGITSWIVVEGAIKLYQTKPAQ